MLANTKREKRNKKKNLAKVRNTGQKAAAATRAIFSVVVTGIMLNSLYMSLSYIRSPRTTLIAARYLTPDASPNQIQVSMSPNGY